MEILLKSSNPKNKNINLIVKVGLYNNNENLRIDLFDNIDNYQLEFNNVTIFQTNQMIKELQKYIENKQFDLKLK